jgi:hypothetical protein
MCVVGLASAAFDRRVAVLPVRLFGFGGALSIAVEVDVEGFTTTPAESVALELSTSAEVAFNLFIPSKAVKAR